MYATSNFPHMSIVRYVTNNLQRVDDPRLNHIHVLPVLRIVSPRELIRGAVLRKERADDDGGFFPRVVEDRARGMCQRSPDDAHSQVLVEVRGGDGLGVRVGGEVECPWGVGEQGKGHFQQGDAAPRQDALFDRSAGSVHRIVIPICSPNLYDSHPAAEFRQPFLQLHFVELARRRVGDDAPDLLAAGPDGVLRPLAVGSNRIPSVISISS